MQDDERPSLEGSDGHQRGRERIGVGAADDGVTRIQLAARWAESYGPRSGDSLASALRRFRAAYDYIDAVTHGVEPADLPSEHTSPAAATASEELAATL